MNYDSGHSKSRKSASIKVRLIQQRSLGCCFLASSSASIKQPLTDDACVYDVRVIRKHELALCHGKPGAHPLGLLAD
jgi:hypothetical protein